MASVFTRIIQGEVPCFKLAEDENFIAILDIQPLVFGHALVIPKTEVDYIFDLDSGTLSGLFVFASQVAKKIEKVVPCQRIGIAVIGLEVPHTHVHLVPLNSVSDIDFSQPKKTFSKEDMAKLAEAIKSA